MFIPWFTQTIIDDVDLEKISLTTKLYRIAGEHELQSLCLKYPINSHTQPTKHFSKNVENVPNQQGVV